MKELKDISFDRDNIILNGHLVKGAILPKNVGELDRDVKIQQDTVIEGAVYGHRIEVENGDAVIKGAAFAQQEIYINSGAKGVVKFEKSIGAVDTVVSHARECKVMMLSDINAREVRLTNAFVGGSIFADEITLVNCVVVGGAFANKALELKSCIVGTFNAPSVTMEGDNGLLLPSAFSLEPVKYNPAVTTLSNYALADLGALYRGTEPTENTGKIRMSLDSDEVKSTLTDEGRQVSVRNYTVIGKVLATDLIHWDKMQNHFLLTAASLNTQLLSTYDLGVDATGKNAELTPERIYDFFMDLMLGKIQVNEIDGSFSIDSLSDNLK
ncbi:MAG: hypothetical protein IKC68_04030 [Bacteroidales bacterium]|nr:hypothetical protein [Bacteroidales bacterium]MBR2856153.1 hypothetical protein [Bacteroidales bacterium]